MTHRFVTLYLTLFLSMGCDGYEIHNESLSIRKVQTEYEYTESSESIQSLSRFPDSCSQREKCKLQPYHSRSSRLKKCCPMGESMSLIHDRAMCVSTNRNINIYVLNVTLYDNCIEDMESELKLPIEIGNPCNTSFLYNDQDDMFFVVQDGSLLLMDPYANDTYTVESKYCIDVESVSGTTYAIVCITAVEDHINRSQIVTVAVLMLISIPCLLLVAYVHVRITELRTVHGMTLSLMSACLATGFLLYSLVHIFKLDEGGIGYAIQFFLLSYYFWFFCLCCNAVCNVWVHIPLKKIKSRIATFFYMSSYCCLSFIGSAILIIFTYQKGLPGMPSYFIQGYTESIRESQRYFIPPVSTLLMLSFFVMVATFFGFQRIKSRAHNIRTTQDLAPNIELFTNTYEEVKKDISLFSAKCISLLGLILISTWLLEIVTFYSPGPQIYLVLMDMLNGLQGVFVLLIFLIVRRRRRTIFRWWNDRGSLVIEKVELELFHSLTS
ncbi:methuselah-like 14 isoform X2 [Haematobia irritans]|uniref:methuselah-like 14 isoform X2 n=1 Tax=Haematobia irritans TaxID=7368 RepID=UPI003F4FFD05